MIASLLFLGLTATAPAAQGATEFRGLWERDPERSDDPEEKVQAARQQMRDQMGGGGGRPGGGGGPPPGSGGPGGGGGMPDFGSVPDELTIEVAGTEVKLDSGERIQIYFLDGEKHRRELPNGMKLETVSRLQGNAILIEEKFERGKIDRKLELGPDAGTLIVTWTIKMGNMKEPVLIRTVYDRVKIEGH